MGEVLEKMFKLPEKKVTVRYIKRKKGMASNVSEDHVISGGMLSGSVKRYCTPLMRNGSLANVLNSAEKEELEKLTGLNLSIYSDFWKQHTVSLFKEDNILDLNNALDYISYKILLSYKNDICPTWSERNLKQTYEFVVVSGDEEINEKKVGFDSKKEAFKLYGKIEDDKDKLLGILKLLTNKPISTDSTLNWLQTKVEEFIDSKPSLFVDLMKDSKFETKLLIQSAEEKGYVRKSGNKYSTIDGLDLCENGQIPTFENAIAYLDSPKHQDVRGIIEAKLLNKK